MVAGVAIFAPMVEKPAPQLDPPPKRAPERQWRPKTWSTANAAHFGCVNRADYEAINALADDSAAMRLAFRRKAVGGSCVAWKAGDQLWIEEIAGFSSRMRVRPKGWPDFVWTIISATDPT